MSRVAIIGMLISHCCVFFFFSSRRRHTRFDCDWSSDVCSSDLTQAGVLLAMYLLSRRVMDKVQGLIEETQKLMAPLESITSDLKAVSNDLAQTDRKSTRLNSSHSQISYAVFCLKKKTHT